MPRDVDTVDLIEGRDYSVTTKRAAPGRTVTPTRATARRVGRPRKPTSLKTTLVKLSSRDPRIMIGVGIAALALEWYRNAAPADDDEPDDADIRNRYTPEED